MGALLQAGLAALRRRLSARVSEASVRRALIGQQGIVAVESVRVGAHGGAAQVLVRIQVAEGCDPQEVAQRASEALCTRLPVRQVSVLSAQA